MCFGGKGLNVSTICTALHIPSTALGFIAGFTGQEIARLARQQQVNTDFICLQEGFSRINIKIKDKEETELNGQGPHADPAAKAALFTRLDRVKGGDILVLSGSVLPGLGADFYAQIMRRMQGKHILFTVDAAGDLLRSTLPYKPFLIKPNKQELSDLFGAPAPDEETLFKQALTLQKWGARNVLVSLGAEGAAFLSETGDFLRMPAVKGEVRNTVGAGDSMIAGFLAGILRTGDYTEAFKLGIAAGSATAFSPGLADEQTILKILNQLG